MTPAELRELDRVVGDKQMARENAPEAIVAGDWPCVIPGSVRANCQECGAYVALSPGSGQRMIVKFPGIAVLCLRCAVRRSAAQREATT